jgi:hypothetical protein
MNKEQDAAQKTHTERAGSHLPRDFKHQGRMMTQCYRSHTKGGRIVLLRESAPRQATGHLYRVFEIVIIDGHERFGAEIGRFQSLAPAMAAASQ